MSRANIIVRGTKDIPKFKPEGAYRAIYDLRGMRFGSWTAIELVSSKKPVSWLCRCDCGREKVFNVSDITRTERKGGNDCGCKKFKKLQDRLKKETRSFAGRDSRLYQKWADMKRRCNSPNRKDSKWYHEKGIGYDENWEEYAGFRDWAIGSGYELGLEIDRIDPGKGYSPDNCQWVTHGDNVRRIFCKEELCR